ncbi:penicillin-binding protein transpeptidase [Clostridium sp. CAG:575]|nr:penicillin-binding protein transpeptidase [Clostridium sp. CAG:575]
MVQTNLSTKKRMRNILFIIFIIIAVLIGRLGYIQLIDGKNLSALAYEQQTLDRYINPKRGTIYDCKGTVLAQSSTVETVTVNPGNIKKEDKETVAKKLTEIFDLNYEAVLKKVTKRSSIETIAKKVEKSKADELREWMDENNITTGINIDEDTKRYYPNNNLAAQIIGFCGSDNQGLDGVEAKYDKTLSGTKGAIKRHTDAKGGEIGEEGETYVAAVDGDDLILTIDANIQSIVEKYLKEACIDNVCTDGGNIVVMNPKNGDILAMATYPDYNLNEPYAAYTEELKGIWDTAEQAEKTKSLQAVWRNRAIADTYEPGSTFKTITSSAALEEGLVTDIDKQGQFACTGGIEVAGVRIKCWRYYRPHGPESLRLALMNSCNPVFIGLGQKIGVHTYYSYLQKFGLLEKTGVDLPGEAGSIFLAENKAGPVELATISFGQRFEITPLQLVTAVSAIANGGSLIQPRIVKAIVDSETKEKTEIETKVKSQVISKDTSEKVLSMMESVVSEGTGKNAKVAGYRIGGKTGTSEDGVNTNKYVTSFIGVAPIEDPQVVMLITLYNPTGEGGHQGGGVAAPVGGQIFREILPYLEVNKGNQDEIETVEQVTVPNIVGMTIKEAEKTVKELGLELSVENFSEEVDKENIIILGQTPTEGVVVNKGSKIFINY